MIQVKREEPLELASSAQLLGISQPVCKRSTGHSSEGREEVAVREPVVAFCFWDACCTFNRLAIAPVKALERKKKNAGIPQLHPYSAPARLL